MPRNYPPYRVAHKVTFKYSDTETITYLAYSEEDETGWEIGATNVEVTDNDTGNEVPVTDRHIDAAANDHKQTWDKDGYST